MPVVRLGVAGTGKHPVAFSWAMTRLKSVARIDNVVFLSRIGSTLRWATQDVAQEDLTPDIKRLLGRLERLEAQRERHRGGNDDAKAPDS